MFSKIQDSVKSESQLAVRRGSARLGLLHLTMAIGLAMTAAALASAPKKPWVAPPSADHFANPVKADATSIAKGKRLYTANCFACHGKSGKGDGPAGRVLKPHPGNLSDPAMWEQSDGAIFWKISRGLAPMPTFKAMPAQDRWSIINYVRTLAPRPVVTPPQFSAPDSNRQALSAVIGAYLDVQSALGANEAARAKSQVGALTKAVESLLQLDASDLDASAQDTWRRDVDDLKTKAEALASSASDLKALRSVYNDFSQSLLQAVADFGHMQPTPVVVFEAKAHGVTSVWAQNSPTPRNPYGKRAGKPSLRERLASR